MSGGLTIKSSSSWLGYEIKSNENAAEVLYKNDKPFQNRLNGLENTTAVSVKCNFNDLHAIRPE